MYVVIILWKMILIYAAPTCAAAIDMRRFLPVWYAWSAASAIVIGNF